MHTLRARLAASRPSAQAYRTSLDTLPSDLTRVSARVGDVIVHPIKGFGGLSVPRARIGREGLVEPSTGLVDRGVMLAALRPGTTDEGAFDAITISNRTEATFALTRTRLDAGALVVEARGMPPLRLDPTTLARRDGPPTRIELYDGGPIVEGTRLESDLARWTADLLRAHPRRRRFDPADVIAIAPRRGARRAVAEKHRAGQEADTLFGDGGHALVASRSTLDWMNTQLARRGSRAIDMEVFRPNVILDGLPPNAEDVIGEAAVDGPEGEAALLFATLCTRCDATRVDIHTGEKPDREPLAFLARERPPRGDDANSATFAINAVARASAHGRTIGRGDPVRILAERST